MDSDFRNLTYFFIAYTAILMAIVVLFAYLLVRVKRLGDDVERIKRVDEERT